MFAFLVFKQSVDIADMAETQFKMPGQHVYDDMVLPGLFTADIMDKIKNDIIFQDDDIIMTSYPKSGRPSSFVPICEYNKI